MGHAAGGDARRRQVRRCVQRLVRQGTGGRPLRRRLPPRQYGRHLAPWWRVGDCRRRPFGRILHCRPCQRCGVDRRHDPCADAGGRAGHHRLRPLRLRPVALRQRVGRTQMRARHGGVRCRRRSWPGPRRHGGTEGLRLPARRPPHPRQRSPRSPGGAAAHPQDGGGEGLRPCQRHQQGGVRRRSIADARHRCGGQGLSRRPPGTRRPRHRPGPRPTPRHPPPQDRHGVAAGAFDHPALRPGPRDYHGGGGEAFAGRGADQGYSVYGGPAPAGDRQDRRKGADVVCPPWRSRSEPDRHRHRRADQGPCRVGLRLGAAVGGNRSQSGRSGVPHSLFLCRMPAQFIDRAAGGCARLRRHRLPLAGAVRARPQDRGRHPDGRRRLELGGRGAVLDPCPHVPEHRRRDLQSLRPDGDPPCDLVGCQHHLQDPVQRCRGDDRRPEERRWSHRATDRPADAGGGRRAHRRRVGRAGQICRAGRVPALHQRPPSR